MPEDCIFCQIVAGDLPAEIVQEDEHTLAFMDINPWTRGHALVIPRAHSPNLYEVEEPDLAHTAAGAKRLAARMKEALSCDGVNVLNACERLSSLGVTPLSFFGTETTEPSVIGWMPAAAVYFRDPDGHLLEYLAMLDEEPRPDRGIVPWSQWKS